MGFKFLLSFLLCVAIEAKTCTELCDGAFHGPDKQVDLLTCKNNICGQINGPNSCGSIGREANVKKTQTLFVALGIGVNYCLLGLQWFTSAQRHVCTSGNSRQRHDVHFLIVTGTVY